MENNPSRNNPNQLAKKLVALGFICIELVELETFFGIKSLNPHPLSKIKRHQNSNQLAKKLVTLEFRRIELVEFETFFEINEP